MISKKGFTLVEMLIVIGAIMVLASLVLVGLGPIQKRSRDARRVSDLRNVQNALELYYNKCGFYPGPAQAGANCAAWVTISASWTTLQTNLTGSALGVTRIPNDPITTVNYFYNTDGTGSTYVLGATLEDTNNSVLANDIDGTVLTIACADPVYCVTL